jgi:hypothetical protein
LLIQECRIVISDWPFAKAHQKRGVVGVALYSPIPTPLSATFLILWDRIKPAGPDHVWRKPVGPVNDREGDDVARCLDLDASIFPDVRRIGTLSQESHAGSFAHKLKNLGRRAAVQRAGLRATSSSSTTSAGWNA